MGQSDIGNVETSHSQGGSARCRELPQNLAAFADKLSRAGDMADHAPALTSDMIGHESSATPNPAPLKPESAPRHCRLNASVSNRSSGVARIQAHSWLDRLIAVKSEGISECIFRTLPCSARNIIISATDRRENVHPKCQIQPRNSPKNSQA